MKIIGSPSSSVRKAVRQAVASIALFAGVLLAVAPASADHWRHYSHRSYAYPHYGHHSHVSVVVGFPMMLDTSG